jgi:hypothetical protein
MLINGALVVARVVAGRRLEPFQFGDLVQVLLLVGLALLLIGSLQAR